MNKPVFFYSCASVCTGSFTPSHYAIPLSANSIISLEVPIQMERDLRIITSVRIAFRASSTRDFFWHPSDNLFAGVVSWIPDDPAQQDVFADALPYASAGIPVLGLQEAFYSGNPTTHVIPQAFPAAVNQVFTGTTLSEETDPRWIFGVPSEFGIIDPEREFLWLNQVGGGPGNSTGPASFVMRRSDLILGEFHGEEYLMTPERKIVQWYRLCDPDFITGTANLTATSGIPHGGLGSVPPEVSVFMSHPSRMLGNIESEAFALFDIYAN